MSHRDPIARAAYNRAYNTRNRARIRVQRRGYYAANPDKRRELNFRRHGLTVEQYETLLARQGGVCAICGKPDRRGWQLSVDHDHTHCPVGRYSCGRCVRGLLCHACNRGAFGEAPVVLRAAADYFEHGGSQ